MQTINGNIYRSFQNNPDLMKYLLVIPFVCLFLISCHNDFKKNSKEVYSQIKTCGTWKNGRKTKFIKGNFFDRGINTLVRIDYFEDKMIQFHFYKLNSGHWLQSYSDSIPIQFYLCDSILDLNGDGAKEFVVQKFCGMGSITDYFFSVYAMKNGQFYKLETLEKLPNVSFQPNSKSFTSLEKSEFTTIGKTFTWNKDLGYKLTGKQQIISYHNCRSINKYYVVKKGILRLNKQTNSDLIDRKFWGFQNWCD